MYAYHHSHLSKYREPFGALPVGTGVRLALDVYEPESGLNCFVRLWHDSEGLSMVPMRCISWGNPAVYEATVRTPDTPGLMWYSFVLEKLPLRLFYGNNEEGMGGEGRTVAGAPKGYQITVYEPRAVPSWYTEGIAYQIFPDRFRRGSDWLSRQEAAIRPDGWRGPKRLLRLDWSDDPRYERNPDQSIARWDFFGGTLTGIREKLLYLGSLGVTTLYLNPIFEASSNHKYDTADYMRVDPGFGDDESLRALVEEAAALDIHIILDGVFSHTGRDSRYFDAYGNYSGGAAQSMSSPYYPWYRFREWPDDYECWWGVKDLPNVDEMEPTYLEYITGEDGVLRHWMAMGIAGWRLDVADELPDEFIERVRAVMSEADPESLLLGEVWEDASNKISYGVRRRYLLGSELQSVMNYPFRDAALDFFLGRIDSMRLTALLLRQMENYPREAFYAGLNLISSHDRERALTLLGEAPAADTLTEAEQAAQRLSREQRDLGVRRLKALSLVQFTLPGVPCIYYGDEAGLEGYRDPCNRRTYPWGREDMDLLYHYRTLSTLRCQHKALTRGSLRMLCADTAPLRLPADVLGYEREYEGERLSVLINRLADREVDVTIEAGSWMLELLSASWYEGAEGRLSLTLPPLGYKVFERFDARPASFSRAREAGVLAHISALPGSGERARLTDAYRFIDFLWDAGFHLWQVLPLTPVGYGGSPYQSPGAFAGETSYLDIREAEDIDPAAYEAFCDEASYWLDDYALFHAIKEVYPAPWQEWPAPEREREDPEALMARYSEGVEREKRAQYLWWSAWQEIRDYAHEKGVRIIGDMPLGVSEDSADTWAHRELFQLDAAGHASLTAGVPPDYYSERGQDWGTPVYDWERLRETGYRWWIERMRHALMTFDYVRLDHFRGFSEYFSIPRGGSPAQGGWRRGPGIEFFKALDAALGESFPGALPIIAEDLGSLDIAVYDLLAMSGYPGMDVYQFEADKMREAGAEEAESRIYYSSTHDSSTLVGWCRETYPEEDAGEKARDIISFLLDSPAPWVILSIQDILGLGDEARFNTPGTVGSANWSWRIPEGALTGELAARLRKALASSSRQEVRHASGAPRVQSP